MDFILFFFLCVFKNSLRKLCDFVMYAVSKTYCNIPILITDNNKNLIKSVRFRDNLRLIIYCFNVFADTHNVLLLSLRFHFKINIF